MRDGVLNSPTTLSTFAPGSYVERAGLAPKVVILGLVPRTQLNHTAAMAGYVYIMASGRNGTLYTGVTTDISKRAFEHREGLLPGFTKKYHCKMLVWFEEHFNIADAIQREKNIKRNYRQWKLNLIEAMNPQWEDLYLKL